MFGEYQTINWKISDLEIKPLSLPYYISSKNITRAINTSESLKILENLFVGQTALFQYGKNYKIGNKPYLFKILLNASVYTDFINRDVTIKTAYDYITKQVKEAGEKGRFIKDNYKIECSASSAAWLDNSIK